MNLHNWTIGRRIGVGFGIILTMLLTVGMLSYFGVGGIVEDAETVIHGNQLDGMLAQKEVDHLNWARKVNALLTDHRVTELAVETDHTKCAFGTWLNSPERQQAEALVPELVPLLKKIEKPHQLLHESAIEIKKVFKQPHSGLALTLAQRLKDHEKWVGTVGRVLAGEVWKRSSEKGLDADNPSISGFSHQQAGSQPFSLGVETDPKQCALGRFLSAPATQKLMKDFPEFQAAVKKMHAPHDRLHESAISIEELVNRGDIKAAMHVYQTDTQKALAEVAQHFQEAIEAEKNLQNGFDQANEIYTTQTEPYLHQTQTLLNDIRDTARDHIMTDKKMLALAQNTQTWVSILGSASVVIGILLAFFISRGIVHILRKISSQMNEGAGQVETASSEVASSSQSLAEGASQQAASLEETSSSLEEMSSVTRQNAANTQRANELVTETNQVVTGAEKEMRELNDSMQKISESSNETQKIVKTIDEIAFQTNLLALNAAVEAARAGEAGAGFAVVADEVRNLAIRAAEAAKETSVLIEETGTRVTKGSEYVTRAGEAFDKIMHSSGDVTKIIADISTASSEQAKGVDQINNAVTEMDKVVQHNAASAEESASASEELNGQAKDMKSMVDQLARLVGGSGNKQARRAPWKKDKAAAPRQTSAQQATIATPVMSKATQRPVAAKIDTETADANDFLDF